MDNSNSKDFRSALRQAPFYVLYIPNPFNPIQQPSMTGTVSAAYLLLEKRRLSNFQGRMVPVHRLNHCAIPPLFTKEPKLREVK